MGNQTSMNMKPRQLGMQGTLLSGHNVEGNRMELSQKYQQKIRLLRLNQLNRKRALLKAKHQLGIREQTSEIKKQERPPDSMTYLNPASYDEIKIEEPQVNAGSSFFTRNEIEISTAAEQAHVELQESTQNDREQFYKQEQATKFIEHPTGVSSFNETATSTDAEQSQIEMHESIHKEPGLLTKQRTFSKEKHDVDMHRYKLQLKAFKRRHDNFKMKAKALEERVKLSMSMWQMRHSEEL